MEDFPSSLPPRFPSIAGTAGRPQSSSSSSWPAREADLRPPDDPHLRTGRLVTVPSWVCLWLPGGPSPQLFSPGPAMGERRRELTWEREREREREWSATPWGTTGGPAYWTSSGEGTRRTRGTNQPAVRGESCSSLLTFPSVWLSADDYLCHQLYSSVLSVQCWIFYFWIVWIFKASNFNEIHKMLSSYEKNLWKKNK